MFKVGKYGLARSEKKYNNNNNVLQGFFFPKTNNKIETI